MSRINRNWQACVELGTGELAVVILRSGIKDLTWKDIREAVMEWGGAILPIPVSANRQRLFTGQDHCKAAQIIIVKSQVIVHG
jgi:hypothetical protein